MSEKQNNKSEELLSLDELIAEAEDKVAVMRKYYVQNKADKQVL